jgi:hypothetical protein
VANFYCTTCHNFNHPNKKKHIRIFQNNNKIILIINSWDIWQHITCSHCSPKKSHFNCKRQYVYDHSKDEGVFRWLFSFIQNLLLFATSVNPTCPTWLLKFSCKCHLQLKISCMDQLQNGHFLLAGGSKKREWLVDRLITEHLTTYKTRV